MLDITEHALLIRPPLHVMQGRIMKNMKLSPQESRRSDAFVYILSGGCAYTFEGGRTFTVREGDLLYLSHKASYEMTLTEAAYDFIFCDFFFDSQRKRKSEVYHPKNSYEPLRLAKRLLSLNARADAAALAESMTLLYSLYTLILTSGGVYLKKTARQKISEAKAYMEANCQEVSLSVHDLAARCSMSDVYFRKLFTSQYALTPSQYLKAARIERAKRLMQYPFLSLEECAYQSGFSSLAYFCRTFKKHTGVTPALYRKTKA